MSSAVAREKRSVSLSGKSFSEMYDKTADVPVAKVMMMLVVGS